MLKQDSFLQAHSSVVVCLIMLVGIGIAGGCDVLLGIDGPPRDADCEPGMRRCHENRPQECTDFIWNDAAPCSPIAPICTGAGMCSQIAMITAGGHHGCALAEADGSVRCWGGNESGQLGDGMEASTSHPVVVQSLEGMIAVSAGGSDDDGFTCAVGGSGNVKCWGKNSFGQLGNENGSLQDVPGDVEGVVHASEVSTGRWHACAIVDGGAVQCWGFDTTTSWKPAKTITGISDATRIAAGARHTCALAQGGDVYCWGYNGDGQCGQPLESEFILEPKKVEGIAGATHLATGYFHTCAVTNEQVFCWGRNDCGQLGRGTYCGTQCNMDSAKVGCGEPLPAPVNLVKLQNSSIKAIDLGGYHSCALTANVVQCWGRNDYLQSGNLGSPIVGHGKPFVATPSPTEIVHAKSISVGAYFGCAMTYTRGLHCWGRNDHGQLGIDTSVQW